MRASIYRAEVFNHFDRIDFNIIVLYELSLQGLLPTASIYRAEVFIHFDRIDFNIIVLYELSLQGSILITTVFVLYEFRFIRINSPAPERWREREGVPATSDDRPGVRTQGRICCGQ